MRRCGKRTRGSRGAAANRRVGVSPYRRAGMQIGTTNGRECGSFNSRPSVSSRGYVEVLHVIGGSNNLRESPGPAVFISEIQVWLTERALHSFGSGGILAAPRLCPAGYSVPLGS